MEILVHKNVWKPSRSVGSRVHGFWLNFWDTLFSRIDLFWCFEINLIFDDSELVAKLKILVTCRSFRGCLTHGKRSTDLPFNTTVHQTFEIWHRMFFSLTGLEFISYYLLLDKSSLCIHGIHCSLYMQRVDFLKLLRLDYELYSRRQIMDVKSFWLQFNRKRYILP